jgi:pyrroline-5-carboxylate reductase
MKRIGIIGFGTMGEAFAVGLRRKWPELALAVFDMKSHRVEAAVRAHGALAMRTAGDAFKGSDITILCVKPQDLRGLSAEVRGVSRGARVISILAGKRTDTIAECLATDQVARFMPSLAAVVGKSVVGVAFGPASAPDFRGNCLEIAGALGSALEIPESLMSAMTGLSGSGLAFIFQFVHAMALGGVAAGFDYSSALSIVISGLEGAASLLRDGAHPMELVSRVTSPAGTTIQGVRALEKGGFSAAVMEAVEAAARRATELEA